MSIAIGTAGWAIPRAVATAFPSKGSALERYAAVFGAVEINSSFHRPHRRATWERWRESVPAAFRFSVKLPKTISHERKLAACEALLATFLSEVSGLGDKLAILLLQLPPKLAYDPTIAEPFLRLLTAASAAAIACEPRHPSWFAGEADEILRDLRIARVAADPAIVPAAGRPGGWDGIVYRRLHGSPLLYRSSYGDGRLEEIAAELRSWGATERTTWCMFDNTAAGAAARDALGLRESLTN
jgi:uncharacterized protein YecE (DUF72 family)